MRSTERRLAHLEAENRRLRGEVYMRPTKVPKGSAGSYFFVTILDGNTIYTAGATTYYGIKRVFTSITTVPSLYDPNAVSGVAGLFSAIDGIGRGTLYVNGTAQAGYVLVLHDQSSTIPTLVAEGNVVVSTDTVNLPLASDSSQSVTAYKTVFR